MALPPESQAISMAAWRNSADLCGFLPDLFFENTFKFEAPHVK
jgi:hypothetical protein